MNSAFLPFSKTADFASFVSAHPDVFDFVEKLIDSYPLAETTEDGGDEPDDRPRAIPLPSKRTSSARADDSYNDSAWLRLIDQATPAARDA